MKKKIIPINLGLYQTCSEHVPCNMSDFYFKFFKFNFFLISTKKE